MSPIYTYECDTCGRKFESMEAWTTQVLKCNKVLDTALLGDPPALTPTRTCAGIAKRVPSLPAPAKFNCSMPTYQKPKT